MPKERGNQEEVHRKVRFSRENLLAFRISLVFSEYLADYHEMHAGILMPLVV
ncbi:hypothetical protein ACYEXS_01070 [Paenibacillus sp. MAH-36]|uniref:hypothetical protein n=1 Tax=Paenibacillus TaxID=44249 RepID=UPI0028FC10A6|nr:hypothetical protein [Paenibacillus sp. PFR10]